MPCKPLTVPAQDYDAWQEWVTTEVLVEHGAVCKRHGNLVEEWPR